MHTHGGYQVAVRHAGDVLFGLDAADVWWATSDIGWIVGHSYMLYGPLLAGATSLMYEGAIDHPVPAAFWSLLEREKVTGLFTSPTAVRLLLRHGEAHAQQADLSHLRRVLCAGEVLNPPAYEWLARTVLNGAVPVLDNIWQTETAAPIFGNPFLSDPQEMPVRPGSAGPQLPGTDSAVVDPDGRELPTGQAGTMVLRQPTPGLTASLWNEPGRYAKGYWERIPGCYYVGDAARVDSDGYAGSPAGPTRC